MSGELIKLATVFAAVTVATGVMVTFLPLAGSPELASVALLTQSLATPAARWLAGRHGDRHGSAGLLKPGVLACALGVGLQFWTDGPVAVVAGMALFGAGFGMVLGHTGYPMGFAIVAALMAATLPLTRLRTVAYVRRPR